MSSTEVSNGNPGAPAHGLRQPLTVVAAMLNEKENLKPWLENLEWADQIILVDHGSVDGSLEQARLQPNCHCISATPGEGLIEDIRRLGIAEVSEGWVLIMDLDERVSGELKSEIEALVESDSTVCGYRIPFRHYVFGRWLKHGGWDDLHLRLFRAGHGSYVPGRIHADAVVEGEVENLQSSILRFAHPTLHDFVMRMNRYTTQSAPLLASGEPGGLRKRVMLPASRWRWLQASASFFWTRYITHRGFRDGMAGFVIAVMLSAYLFVEQSKAWEYSLETQS